jgi:hypothetical protein
MVPDGAVQMIQYPIMLGPDRAVAVVAPADLRPEEALVVVAQFIAMLAAHGAQVAAADPRSRLIVPT